MDSPVILQPGETGPDYRRAALAYAKENVPGSLRWSGIVLLALAILNNILPPPSPAYFVAMLLSGAGLYALGVYLRRPGVPAAVVPWANGVSTFTLYCTLLLMHIDRPVPWDFVYFAVVLAAFGPLTFTWAPFITFSAAMFAATFWVLQYTGTEHPEDWLISLLAAIGVSTILLRTRKQSIRKVADGEFAREQLVQSDVLTGLLNRRGLYARIEAVWAGAQRRDEQVHVAFIDVVGLKRANDDFGHELGDRIIMETANAIRESVRADDLVARWGGDEFVVVAKGDVAAAEVFTARIVSILKSRAARFDGHWHGLVTVGTATGMPSESDFEELLALADTDMCARRQGR